MIKVTTDTDQKLVEVIITGFIKTPEAARVSDELKKTMIQFGPKDAVLLIDLVGFAPMSADVLPILRGMGRDVIGFFRKTALLQEFPMDFAGRKIIEAPPGYKMRAFLTRDEAMKYLMEPNAPEA